MKALQLIVGGNWGHFKKPETNNNPLTHDFMHKTAFVGMMGAVLGISRTEMKPLFPLLCDNLGYGIKILNDVQKESWGFTMRKAVNVREYAPKAMELLKKPKFHILIGLQNEETKSLEIFERFCSAIKNNETKFTPVLGIHNCPAYIEFVNDEEVSEITNGSFEIACVSSNQFQVTEESLSGFRIGLDRIPVHQNNSFLNTKYEQVFYAANGNKIQVSGNFNLDQQGEAWWLM